MRTHHLIQVALLLAGLVAPVAPANGAPDLVAHEWGTFTQHFDASGQPVMWMPLQVVSDLPNFVLRAAPRVTRKNTIKGTVRMETPVIYLYAEQPLTATVTVEFPNGTMSEWYPRAAHTQKRLRWPRVRVLPGATVDLPRESADSHYYPARETDGAILRCRSDRRTQYEKFLFYRGVGTFDLPISARLDGTDVVVHNAGPDAVPTVLVVESHDGQIGHAAGTFVDGQAMVARPTVSPGGIDVLAAALQTLLVDAGLFEREAQAMIATWRGTWSEPGLRVLYVVPRRLTDAVLPLSITPAPSTTVRVLVGRGEIALPDAGT